MRFNRQETRTISEQAAEWLVVLSEGSAHEQTAFMEWLRKSPRHVEEFLFVTTTWRKLWQARTDQAMDVEQIVAEALGEGATNVLALPNDSFSSMAPSAAVTTATKRRRRSYWIASVAAASVTMVVGAWWYVTGPYAWHRYATAVGEQRTVRLTDGSVLYLNTASRARVDFSATSRKIELLDGEALFVVAQDARRPFRVTAGDAVIQALGTQFNVRRRIGSTHVSVIEGRVKVEEQSASRSTSVGAEDTRNVLGAGEEGTITGNGEIVKRHTPDVALAVAWRERRLVFRSERLEDVVAEINRYSIRHFHVEGERARNTQLTATFDADKPESLASFLQRYSDLSVEVRDEDFVIRER